MKRAVKSRNVDNRRAVRVEFPVDLLAWALEQRGSGIEDVAAPEQWLTTDALKGDLIQEALVEQLDHQGAWPQEDRVLLRLPVDSNEELGASDKAHLCAIRELFEVVHFERQPQLVLGERGQQTRHRLRVQDPARARVCGSP
eukprot:CAMPEP_0181179888 /NCGR_PEP_ID=MMETSP1096-20121128/6504_1 /TAXON_ID=156174 ORGANISM="Chrysochromulina ericina, Strain CCMP281" /NCGR_SAMPLE_ID=MMETSP1096 /ASSEMBLY_ACC=CAM_ASM_000453 /LENGTH=141 /DNA_ID=CAMNT_0023268275 /DNA_START=186 /DNA_END=611 /DNA_ORIENTATION=+